MGDVAHVQVTLGDLKKIAVDRALPDSTLIYIPIAPPLDAYSSHGYGTAVRIDTDVFRDHDAVHAKLYLVPREEY